MPATMLLVVIAIVGAVALWSWTGGLPWREEPPAVGFFGRNDGCHPRLVVTAVAAPVDLTNVRVAPAEEAGPYAILFGGRVAVDEPWRGEPPAEFLTGGSTIDLWATEGRLFTVADDASGTVLAQVRAPAPPPDAAAPSATLDGPTTVTAPVAALTGTATDGPCGGVALVTVRLTSVATGGVVTAVADLAAEGGATSAWELDLSASPLVPGAEYAVTVSARDLAGNGA